MHECCALEVQQILGEFSEDLELDFKLFFLMDSGSAYIVLEKSEWCHSGIIEHFDIFKMASKMAANYKLKNYVVWKNVSNPFFP